MSIRTVIEQEIEPLVLEENLKWKFAKLKKNFKHFQAVNIAEKGTKPLVL